MRTRVVLLTALALFAVAGPAVASTFNFSYMFATGQVVSGTFTGTRDDNGTPGNLLDDFVFNPTFGSVLYQGTPMAGPIFANQYDNTGWVGGPTRVYFTGTSNNFLLSVCPPGPAACAVSNWEYFMMRAIPQGFVGAEYYHQTPLTLTDDSAIAAARWSLTEAGTAPAAVPEPATLTLLGLGLGGVATLVRRR